MQLKKIIEKMNRQPASIRFEEAEKVLNFYGYYIVRQKGSHAHFYNEEKRDLITIKIDSPLKKVYIKDILSRIGA